MKYIIQGALRYEFTSRAKGTRCANQRDATLTGPEAYEFARLEREKVGQQRIGNRVFIIEGLPKGGVA